MKKWIESWLIPFVNKFAKTKTQKRIFYIVFIIGGIITAWFGLTVSQVATEQLFVLDQTPLGRGVLK